MRVETSSVLCVQARWSKAALQKEQNVIRRISARENITPHFVNALTSEIEGKQLSQTDFITKIQETYPGLPILLLGSGDAHFHADPRSEGYYFAMQYIARTEQVIQEAHDRKAFLLAICLGHQAVGHVLRKPGSPPNIERRGKTGTYALTLTRAGEEDYLFQQVVSPIKIGYGHSGQLIYMPDGFEILGFVQQEGKYDPYSALAKDNFRTLQAHPELYTRQEAIESARLAGYYGDFKEPANTDQILINFLRKSFTSRRMIQIVS